MKEVYFPVIDSTNAYLKEHYREHEDMTFVQAGLQTAGRGRNDRKWNASAGKNLTFSLLIRDKDLFEHYKALSVLSAYAVIKALEEYDVSDLMIKWPNDVYAGGKKICGILLEAVSREKMECLIIGIGINVNEDDFSGDYLHEPTSLKLCRHQDIDLDEFRERVYEQLCLMIDDLKKGKDLYPEIVAYDYLKGKEAYGEVRGERKKIRVAGIAKDHTLEVVCDGEILHLASSEITFHI